MRTECLTHMQRGEAMEGREGGKEGRREGERERERESVCLCVCVFVRALGELCSLVLGPSCKATRPSRAILAG